MTASPNKCYSGCYKAIEKEEAEKHFEKRPGKENVDSGFQV